jgi:hypothetical protein
VNGSVKMSTTEFNIDANGLEQGKEAVSSTSPADDEVLEEVGDHAATAAARLLGPLMQEPVGRLTQAAVSGLLIGRLLALVDDGCTPLVTYAGQPTCGGVRARNTVHLHSGHVGHDVVLGFELLDPTRPIVLGVVQGQPGWPWAEPPMQVTLEAGGQRMVVVAERELVLRCGKASISLRHDGRVEIRGENILTQAAGPNRIQGGSVELN